MSRNRVVKTGIGQKKRKVQPGMTFCGHYFLDQGETYGASKGGKEAGRGQESHGGIRKEGIEFSSEGEGEQASHINII